MPSHKPPATDTTLAALYKAVLADPDDDLPRLVYADRLDELGDHPRAEFIRLQIHVAKTNPWDDGHADALVRSEVLYEKHKHAWGIEQINADLKGFDNSPAMPQEFKPFVRGFPEVMWAKVEALTAARRKRLRTYPIRELHLRGVTPATVGRVLESINEAGVRAVDLDRPPLGVLDALATGPVLPTLRRLTVQVVEENGPSAGELTALATSGNFPNIEAVDLIASGDEAQLLAFLRNVRWPKLTDLRVVGPFTREATTALVELIRRSDSRRVSVLKGMSHGGPTIDVTPLFESALSPSLRALEVCRFVFGAKEAQALAAAAISPLDEFVLDRIDSGVVWDPAVYRTVLRAPFLAGVKSINLQVVNSDATRVATLIGRLRQLRELDWGMNAYTVEAVAAFARSPVSQSLRRWRMYGLSLDATTVPALLAGRSWPNLAELVCPHGAHDGREVAKLIDHPHFARLRHLNVAGSSHGLFRRRSYQASAVQTADTAHKRAADLWRRLAKSKTVGRFHKLRLDFPITDPQLNALLDNPEVRKIGHLALPQRVDVTPETERRFEQVFGILVMRDG